MINHGAIRTIRCSHGSTLGSAVVSSERASSTRPLGLAGPLGRLGSPPRALVVGGSVDARWLRPGAAGTGVCARSDGWVGTGALFRGAVGTGVFARGAVGTGVFSRGAV